MNEKIVVFGSFVVDLMARSPHLPTPGETVKGSVFKMGPGGKGFNQGVAAHKAGANVKMVTKLGKDLFAEIALEAMQKLAMDSSYVLKTDTADTGAALIAVDEKTGQNQIVVNLGACNTISDEEVDSLTGLIEEASYLLTQLETNISAVKRVIDIAYEKKTKVILNTAPVQPVDDETLKKVYIVTPNEVEAEIFTGVRINDEKDADKAVDWFFNKGVKNVIITLGEKGAYVATSEQRKLVPAYKVKAVDTTGAGDAFNGGLVAALAEGKSLWEAARFANALAALSVQKLGTTPSMPTRKEIEEFLAVSEKN